MSAVLWDRALYLGTDTGQSSTVGRPGGVRDPEKQLESGKKGASGTKVFATLRLDAEHKQGGARARSRRPTLSDSNRAAAPRHQLPRPDEGHERGQLPAEAARLQGGVRKQREAWALKPGRPGLKTQLCRLQTAPLSKFHLSWPPPSVCKIQGTAYPTPRVVMRIRGGDPESAWPTREPQSPVDVPPLPVQGPQRLVRGNLKFKGIPRPHWRFGHSAILKSDESPDPRHSVPPKTTRKAPRPASLNTEPFLRRGGQVWPTSSTLTAKDSKVAS